VHIEDGLADLDAGRVHTHEEIEDLVREFERLADEEASP
jgi:predicted transcriptional regulator